MVLTDRQRADLHAGIYDYLKSRPGDAFEKAAAALLEADPAMQELVSNSNSKSSSSTTPLLEKKWTAIPRLQKKVLELERTLAQSAKIHAHRTGLDDATTGSTRRMLPRPPCTHKLAGHAQVVTAVAVHPVFTLCASGSEDGTVKVCANVYVRVSLAVRISECSLRLIYSLIIAYHVSSGTTRAASTCAP
jgi:platelet-activating factor acetylhydrolase IB subunit alpha